MAESATDRLCSETGIARSTVDALGALDDAQAETLLAAFRQAAVTRKAELDTATNDGLQVLPRLLRPAVKRIIFS